MSCLGIHPPRVTNWDHAFGWVHREGRLETKKWSDDEKSWILFNNVANIAGYILSPIIGLIRIIVNAYFLAKNKDVQNRSWTDKERMYLKAQIARGVAELFGGGYLLWIPDLIATISRA